MEIKRVWNMLLDILFPPQCVSCGVKFKTSANRHVCICDKCFETIQIHSGFFCPACKRRLPEPRLVCHHESGFALAAATDYENKPARELIHALKYASITSAATPLVEILGRYLEKSLFCPQGIARLASGGSQFDVGNSIIIPIPLHTRRERERGYNQTTLVLDKLRTKFPALPLIKTKVLMRAKHTHSQIEMKSHEERVENVRGCFRVANPAEIKGKTILLADDVFTSGATMREAVRTLKSAGAKKVIALVIAKA